jgi:hypothetical protein
VPLAEDQRTKGGLLMSHETTFEKPASLGQLKEIVATLVQTVPTDLSSYDAQRIIENKGWLIGEVHDLFTLRTLLLDEWRLFYHEVFGLDVNFSTLKIPKRLTGITRLLVVDKGLSLKRVIETSKKHYGVEDGPSGRYYYGDQYTRGVHDRVPAEPYAVWVRDQVDPDLKYKDLPARLLKERAVQGVTLLEHLLFHLKYFRETGQHLDSNRNDTLCLGSRDAYGCIPCVSYHSFMTPKYVYIGYGTTSACVREVVA